MSEGEILSPSSSNPLDVNSLRSRIEELRDFYESSYNAAELSPEETEKSLDQCVLELEKKIDEIVSESVNVRLLPDEELGELLERLKTELSAAEDENVKIESEIEELSRRYIEDCCILGSELEGLSCSLSYLESQSLEKTNDGMLTCCSGHLEDQANLTDSEKDAKFKMLELSHQVEKNKATQKTMQDLNSILERFEAEEKVEDALTGYRVIEFEGNCLRLDLKTYIPNMENFPSQQNIEDDPLELNHEMIIETVDGTLEPKNVEIFPNDVFIGDIVDAAKSFRQYSPSPVIEKRSCLEWFVRRVQDRIALCSLRRHVVKSAKKSRHSIEYLDREDMIVAHMVGGVDAFIKMSQEWPFLNSALELMCLQSTSQNSKEISLSFLCKILEMANSLIANLRWNVSSFVASIEEILMQQMREELQPDNIGAK